MNSHRYLVSAAMMAVLLLGLAAGLAAAQAPDGGTAGPDAVALGTSFTYQGQLIVNGTPANGSCDFRFTLYDAASSGSQVGSAVVKPALPVTGGLFTTDLDFGTGIFAGQKRWLQVEASCPASASPSYTVVGALQELTATPYALYAASAGGSSGWSLTGNAGTTPGTNYLGTSDNKALELKVNGARALRIEPNATSPNLVGGYSGNSVTRRGVGGHDRRRRGHRRREPCHRRLWHGGRRRQQHGGRQCRPD